MSQHRPPRRRSGDGGEEPSIRRAARKAVDRGAQGGPSVAEGDPRQPSRAKVGKSAKTADPRVRFGRSSAGSNGATGGNDRRAQRGAKALPPDLRTELAKATGSANVEKTAAALIKASDAMERGRDRDAVRMLKTLRDQVPDAAPVRELLGVALYRLGRYEEARRELDTFVDLTGNVDQHPVLMDCLRALKRYRRIVKLWDELRDVSPSAELVIEGRIVMAGAMADRGDLVGAIALLERGPLEPKKVRPHHLRLWYALADLSERSGNIPRARSLFERIRTQDPQFVDVANRLSSLA